MLYIRTCILYYIWYLGWSKFIFAGPSPCPYVWLSCTENRVTITFGKNKNFSWDGATHCTLRSSQTKPPFRTFCLTSYCDVPLHQRHFRHETSHFVELHTNTYPEKWGRNLLDRILPSLPPVVHPYSQHVPPSCLSWAWVSRAVKHHVCAFHVVNSFLLPATKAPDVFAAACFVYHTFSGDSGINPNQMNFNYSMFSKNYISIHVNPSNAQEGAWNIQW